jgi:hypothetical protein
MIAEIVFESSIESTAMRNDSDSLSSLITNLLIEILSNEISSMFNFSKNWVMKSSSWLSSNSMINCFKRRSNLWRDFHLRFRFAKRFLKSSRFFFVWFVDQQLNLSHTKHFFEARTENLSRDRELMKNLRLLRLLSNSRCYCLSINFWSWVWYSRWCRCFENTCYSFYWLIRNWRCCYRESWSDLKDSTMSYVIRSIKSNDLCMFELEFFAFDSNRDNQNSILFERHRDQHITFENIRSRTDSN